MTDMLAVGDIHQDVTITATHYHEGYDLGPPSGVVLGYRWGGRGVEWVVWTIAADGTTQNGFYTYTHQRAMNRFFERAMVKMYVHQQLVPPALTYDTPNPEARL